MRTFLLVVHALAAGIWIGSMFYSLFVFQKKAFKHFKNLREFEDLVVSVSAGARHPVLLALGVILVTGGLLALPLFEGGSAFVQRVLMAKIGLFIFATILFAYVSWGLWPKRIFVDETELPVVQRKFRIIGFSILTTAVIAFVLGILIR
jgi:uncharacterized membrane protein